ETQRNETQCDDDENQDLDRATVSQGLHCGGASPWSRVRSLSTMPGEGLPAERHGVGYADRANEERL
ncbi:MAG: hypothetical protein ACJ74E_10330, partial [Actinomycetes bacterium]